MSQAILFAGPSLNQVSKDLLIGLDLDCRPPCQRLDIAKVLKDGQAKYIIIVDGLFHQVNSVGYREIVEALAQDIEIWGLSSMGAIRAYELRHLGMKGFGQVYDRFFEEEDFQDDEVALLHGPSPDYLKFSEPLIHMRLCIDDLVEQGSVCVEHGFEIIAFLKQEYFGERTLGLFSETLLRITGQRLEALVTDFNQYRQKEHDLFQFLYRKIWLDG
ncbi:MAG: TfuA-related McrA-glycine thioamidation protein [Saprospiraceae bacterium]|nr:TfuA-related McrA-glycine thioamidation protein [Saprospiraceae bacterium]